LSLLIVAMENLLVTVVALGNPSLGVLVAVPVPMGDEVC
jgi:hypothetical protein